MQLQAPKTEEEAQELLKTFLEQVNIDHLMCKVLLNADNKFSLNGSVENKIFKRVVFSLDALVEKGLFVMQLDKATGIYIRCICFPLEGNTPEEIISTINIQVNEVLGEVVAAMEYYKKAVENTETKLN